MIQLSCHPEFLTKNCIQAIFFVLSPFKYAIENIHSSTTFRDIWGQNLDIYSKVTFFNILY